MPPMAGSPARYWIRFERGPSSAPSELLSNVYISVGTSHRDSDVSAWSWESIIVHVDDLIFGGPNEVNFWELLTKIQTFQLEAEIQSQHMLTVWILPAKVKFIWACKIKSSTYTKSSQSSNCLEEETCFTLHCTQLAVVQSSLLPWETPLETETIAGVFDVVHHATGLCCAACPDLACGGVMRRWCVQGSRLEGHFWRRCDARPSKIDHKTPEQNWLMQIQPLLVTGFWSIPNGHRCLHVGTRDHSRFETAREAFLIALHF